MKPEIKILIIEHDSAELEKLLHELNSGGLNFTFKVAQGENDYKRLLASFSPDIILAVYTSPVLNGPAAFLIRQETVPHVPFIIMSGAIGEENAIELVRAGVTDFVFKDHLITVVTKIARALKEVNDRKGKEMASRSLQVAIHDMKKIMDSSLDVICAVSDTGYFLEVSAACESVWGYKASELIGTQLMDLVFPEDLANTQKASINVMAGNSHTYFENRYVHKNGSLVQMAWSARWDANTRIRYGVGRNVSEKKNLENALEIERERFYELFRLAPTSIAVLKGPDHIFEMANPGYDKLVGNKELIGKKLMDVILEIAGQGFIEILDEIYKTGTPFSGNEMLVQLDKDADGKFIDTYLNFVYQAYRNDEGSIEGVFLFNVDVTETVLSRKKLEESEKKYRLIVETAQEGIWLIDENNNTILVNQKMADILEYTREEMLGKQHNDFMDKSWKKKAASYIKSRKLGINENHDFSYITKSGKEVWTNVSANPVFDDAGLYKGTLAMVTDITEAKTLAAKMQSSERQYRILFEQNLAAVYQSTIDGRIINCNHAFAKMLKYDSPEALLSINATELYFSPLVRSNFIAELQQHEKLSNYEVLLRCSDGSAVNVLENITLRKDQDTGLEYCDGILINITERKKTEQQMNWLINNTEESFILLNRKLEIVSFNNQVQRLYLKYFEKVLIKGKSILNYALPERREMVKDLYQKVLGGQTESSEIVIPLPGHAIKNFTLKYKPAKDEFGNIIGVFVSAIDITASKENQQQLIIQEKRYRALVENGADAVAIVSAAGDILYVSPTIENILGYTEGEVMRLQIFDLAHPDDVSEIAKVWDEVMANPGKAVKGHTSRMKHKNGSWRWLEATVTNMLHDPALNGIVDNFRDVTDNVLAEQLSVFEKRDKEALINTTSDLIWSMSSDFKLIAANRAFINNLLLSTGILLKPGDELVLEGKYPPELLLLWKNLYQRSMKGESFIEEIYTPQWGSYPETWAETRFNPIYNGNLVTGVACYTRDTTASKKFQNSLVDINKKLEIAQSIAMLGYLELDIDRDTIYCSKEVYKIWGVTPEIFTVNFKKFYNSIHPADKAIFDKAQKAALEGKGRMEIEYRIILPDNSIKYIHEKGELVYNEQGKAIRFEGSVQDITSRKTAEAERKELTNRLLLATNSAGLGIWDWDIEKDQLSWDRGMHDLYKIERDQFECNVNGWLSRLHAEDQSRVKADLQLAIAGTKEFNTEFRILWEDNSVHYIKATSIVERDEHESIFRMIGVNYDITEQKEKEQQLKLLESVITNTTDSVMITEAEPFDETGPRIVYVNAAFTKMTGYSSSDVLGKTSKLLQGINSDKEELQRLSEAIHTWKHCEITTINYKKTGEEFWVNTAITPIANSEGWFTHWIAIERDITERKHSEIRLNELNTDLGEQAKALAFSNAELEQFAYVASHDLQEPLRMVTSFLTLLEKRYGSVIDDKGKQYIAFAVDGAKRMRQIILDLLEFSRVGAIEDKLENVDLNELMQEIRILFKKQVQENAAIVDTDVLPVIYAHKAPLRQVFQNLLGNALKYHRKDIALQIHISVTDRKDDWLFAISDNGIGIDPAYFDKIFIIFQRLHQRDEFSGTGIGLAITKKIIENDGGRIWVTSEEGQGSTFYFTLIKHS